MRRSVWVTLLALAACAPGAGQPPLPPVRVEPAPVAGIPPGTGFPAAQGEAELAVRAFAGGVEVQGASCTAQSTIYRAEFVAPARLLVPAFGRQSPEIRVDCASGGLRGAALAQPYLQRGNGAGGFPAVGVGVSSGGGSYVSLGGFWNGGWGWNNPRSYVTRYPAVQVELR